MTSLNIELCRKLEDFGCDKHGASSRDAQEIDFFSRQRNVFEKVETT